MQLHCVQCVVSYTAQCHSAAVPLQLTGLKPSAAVERREVDEPCPICFEEMDEVAACCSDVSHVAAMHRMLQRIRDGAFAERFRADARAGFPWMNARRAEAASDAIEEAGRAVRGWLPWLQRTEERG